MVEYQTLKKIAEASGYTPNALHIKVQRGKFIEGLHYTRPEDGRILFHVENFNRWCRGLAPLPTQD